MEDEQLDPSVQAGCSVLSHDQNPLHFNVVLLGKTGSGKSASGNTILGKRSFLSKRSPNAVTQEVQKERVTFEGVTLDVYDTPGLFDPERNNENLMEKCQPLFQLDPSVPMVFLLVMKADRFTPEEQQTVELIEEFVPEWFLQNTWILFTRGDELEEENITLEQFIEETEELKRVVQRFNNRHHLFNNKTHDPGQVRRLIQKIQKGKLNLAPEIRLPRTRPDPERDPLQRRIVLMGKTGVGKSASGNTLLCGNRFKSELSFSSVTKECEIHEAFVAGRNVCVVDTPGLFDTETPPEQVAIEIGRSVYLSAPGPHAFLYVLRINDRFTQQEEDVVQKFETMFGEDVRKYTIILFTYGDQLEGASPDEVINKNKSLRRLIEQCGGRYHVFNNKDQCNREQVTELLDKIDRMVQDNGGSCYSNEMFEDAARFRKEEENQRKQEEIERVRKETEEKIRQEMERVRKETEQKARQEMERIKKETEEKIRQMERVRKETEQKARQEMEGVIKETEEKIRQEMERIRKEIEQKARQEMDRKQREDRRKRERENSSFLGFIKNMFGFNS